MEKGFYHLCKTENFTQLKEWLKKNHKKLNSPNVAGYTILHEASYHGNVKGVKLLLKYRTNPNIQNRDGRTALHRAVVHGHEECVKLLLKHGGDPNIQNMDGRTALHWPSYWGYTEIIKLLLVYGANPNIKNKDGETAFDVAKNKECKEILQNWKTYLPEWNRYTTAKYYPIEFNQVAFAWLSSSNLPKDLRYLVLPDLAEKWKLK